MPTPAQLAESKAEFQAAKAQAGEIDGMVCGTYDSNGRPRYFVVPKETPDADLVDQSFALKHGRSMSAGERTLLSLAEERLGALAAQRTGRVELTGG